MVASIAVPDAGKVTAMGTYLPNGAYEAVGYFRGEVMGVSTGVWSLSNNTLSVRAKSSGESGSYKATSTIRLVGRDRFVFVSTLSNGMRIFGTFRRQ